MRQGFKPTAMVRNDAEIQGQVAIAGVGVELVITLGTGFGSALFLDVHLMIVDPGRFIEDFVKAGADRLIVHQESCTHIHRVLSSIKESGIEAGVTINPGTSIDAIVPVLDLVDLVQIMTVNPGFGGQSFIHSQLEKIRQLKQILKEQNLDVAIAVDGGIHLETAPLVVEAGATVLVAGSSVYNSKASVKDNLAGLYAAMESVKQQ